MSVQVVRGKKNNLNGHREVDFRHYGKKRRNGDRNRCGQPNEDETKPRKSSRRQFDSAKPVFRKHKSADREWHICIELANRFQFGNNAVIHQETKYIRAMDRSSMIVCWTMTGNQLFCITKNRTSLNRMEIKTRRTSVKQQET